MRRFTGPGPSGSSSFSGTNLTDTDSDDENDEPVPVIEMLASFNERSSTGRVVVNPPQAMPPGGFGFHETGESWYICRACGRSYLDKQKYLDHVEEHDAEDFEVEIAVTVRRSGPGRPRGFKQSIYDQESASSDSDKCCKICNLSYTRIATLREHQNNYHNEANPYPCPNCICKFTTLLTLERHIRRAHGIEPNPNRSRVLKKLSIKNKMSVNIAQSKLKIAAELQRKKLSSISNSNSILTLHLQKWNCHICKAVLRSRNALKGHIMRHTGEKPFLCKYCPSRFRHLANVNRHMTGVHLTQGQYKCDKCSCSYQKLTNLLCHIRTQHPDARDHTFLKVYDVENTREKRSLDESQSQPGFEDEDAGSGDEYRPYQNQRRRSKLVTKRRRISSSHSQTEEEPKPVPDFPPSLHMCKVCGKLLKSSQILQVHMRTHTGELPYSCGKCGLQFRTNSNIWGHKKVAHSGGNHKCTKCTCTFHSENGLRQHSINIHYGKGRNFVHHANNTKSEKFYSQPEVVSKFTKPTISRETAAASEVLDDDGNGNVFECKACGKMLANKDTFTGHMRIHTGEKPYKCECGIKFRLYSTLISHRRVAHTNGKFKCSKCICCYHNLRSLKKHMRNIHAAEPVFKADLPKKTVIRSKSGNKNACEICGKTFMHSYSLIGHMRIHTGEKPYKCNYCGIRFKLSSTLHSHLQTNHAAGEFKCKFCSCSFHAKVSLGSHVKKYHFGKIERFNREIKHKKSSSVPTGHLGVPEKQLINGHNRKCPICDKVVSSGSNLRHHLFAHTGERPYQCKHCGEKYRHMANVWRHLKTHSEVGHTCVAGTCAAISQQIIDKHLAKVKMMTLNRKRMSIES